MTLPTPKNSTRGRRKRTTTGKTNRNEGVSEKVDPETITQHNQKQKERHHESYKHDPGHVLKLQARNREREIKLKKEETRRRRVEAATVEEGDPMEASTKWKRRPVEKLPILLMLLQRTE
jgi:hypothetical protein